MFKLVIHGASYKLSVYCKNNQNFRVKTRATSICLILAYTSKMNDNFIEIWNKQTMTLLSGWNLCFEKKTATAVKGIKQNCHCGMVYESEQEKKIEAKKKLSEFITRFWWLFIRNCLWFHEICQNEWQFLINNSCFIWKKNKSTYYRCIYQ